MSGKLDVEEVLYAADGVPHSEMFKLDVDVEFAIEVGTLARWILISVSYAWEVI